MINAIPLLEAQASSAIENIVTTTDELFTAAAADTVATPAARETLRYRSALRVGFDELASRPIAPSMAERICSEVRGHRVSVRSGEVFIGDPVSRARSYTPPPHRVLPELLDNWASFVNGAADLDPLVRMAVAHYQFEAIHPFSDGNGRTGRIINVLMLCAAGLLEVPLLYLSREIIETKDEYYRRLLAVTAEGAWEPWVLYMLEQIRASAKRTGDLVEDVSRTSSVVLEATRAATGTANADLSSVLMEQPYARIRNVMERCGVSRPTATKWLKLLAADGTLREVAVGREVLFVNIPLLSVLQGASATP